MRIKLVEVDPKATEDADSACTFGSAVADVLQISLVCGERSIKFRRRREILVFGVHCSPR